MATTIPASNACASRTLHGMTIWTRSGFLEGGHQLEKLEFALALAEAKGDQRRCSQLRDRIADLGAMQRNPVPDLNPSGRQGCSASGQSRVGWSKYQLELLF